MPGAVLRQRIRTPSRRRATAVTSKVVATVGREGVGHSLDPKCNPVLEAKWEEIEGPLDVWPLETDLFCPISNPNVKIEPPFFLPVSSLSL